MENFIAYNPTQLHFGKGVVQQLGEAVKSLGSKALFIYGKGSVKKNGVYDAVLQQLQSVDTEIFEYSGIKANPIVEDADAALKVITDNKVDIIVAVGGGSVIDTAKIISLAAASACRAWDIPTGKVKPSGRIPLVAVLTLAATGTEMNGNAVLQNHATEEKLGYSNPLAFPVHSFLDPSYTCSVSREQTVNGIVDTIAHSFENYFGYGDAPLTDSFTAAIIKEQMTIAGDLLEQPDNYDLRARKMWAATCALNGLTASGRRSGDWGVHQLAHNLSLLFDTAHGATLSITIPAWLKFHKDIIPDRIAHFGMQLFGTHSVSDAIAGLEDFFRSINSPVRLGDIGKGEAEAAEIVRLMEKSNCSGANLKLTAADYPKIVNLMING